MHVSGTQVDIPPRLWRRFTRANPPWRGHVAYWHFPGLGAGQSLVILTNSTRVFWLLMDSFGKPATFCKSLNVSLNDWHMFCFQCMGMWSSHLLPPISAKHVCIHVTMYAYVRTTNSYSWGLVQTRFLHRNIVFINICAWKKPYRINLRIMPTIYKKSIL